MKNTFACLAAIIALSAGTAFAGSGKMVVADKSPIVVPPACYNPGMEFGIFGAGIFGGDSDEFGGGVSLGYFFTEAVGVDLGYHVFTTESEEHFLTADLVWRCPDTMDDCWTPYLFGGVGYLTNSVQEALGRAGAGVDFRVSESMSIFGDASYNWIGGDVDDAVIVRAGLRFPF